MGRILEWSCKACMQASIALCPCLSIGIHTGSFCPYTSVGKNIIICAIRSLLPPQRDRLSLIFPSSLGTINTWANPTAESAKSATSNGASPDFESVTKAMGILLSLSPSSNFCICRAGLSTRLGVQAMRRLLS